MSNNEEYKKSNSLEKFLTGTVILLLIAQTFFSILNYRGIQQLSKTVQSISSHQSEEFLELINRPYKDFKLTDNENSDVLLSTLIGKPVLMVFTSHTCQACQMLYPELQSFSKDNQDVIIVLITTNSVEENIDFLKANPEINQLGWKILAGTHQTYNDYLITGTPTLIYIDEAGIIRNIGYA
jgi:thiol-disulfide isomerase/thioredoxin